MSMRHNGKKTADVCVKKGIHVGIAITVVKEIVSDAVTFYFTQ